jgi:hypothetical protein
VCSQAGVLWQSFEEVIRDAIRQARGADLRNFETVFVTLASLQRPNLGGRIQASPTRREPAYGSDPAFHTGLQRVAATPRRKRVSILNKRINQFTKRLGHCVG